MADVKISELGSAATIADSDYLVVDTGAATLKSTAALVKKYMIGDTDISGLGDGSVTGAIDAVNDKIEDNVIPTMTKNGAHNLLPNTATTQTVNSKVFTVASDGKISVTGTSNAQDAYCEIVASFKFDKSGIYKLSGCPSGGGATTYQVYVKDLTTNDVYRDYGSGVSITADASHSYTAYVMVYRTEEPSGLVFSPMITVPTDTDTTYAPYAKTNRELTEELKTVPNGNSIFFTKATGGSIENNASWAEKYGKVIVVNLQVKFSTSASSPALGTLSIKPKYMSTAVVVAGGSLSTVSVNTSSGVISLNGNISSGWIYGQLVFVYE